MFKGTLQRKILIVVVFLVFLMVFLMLSLFIYTDYKRVFQNAAEKGIQTTKILSQMDSVQWAMSEGNTDELKPLIDYYVTQSEAAFIVIKDREGKVLAHPVDDEIGELYPSKDETKALVFGGSYNLISYDIVGSAVVAISPIYVNRQIVGTARVGYLVKDLRHTVIERTKKLAFFSLSIFVIGILLSIWLARQIRKDTFGMEPQEIAVFYMERHAVLASISEGLIATDGEGKITIINTAARKILNISSDYKGQAIQSVFPSLQDSKLLNIQQKPLTFELKFQKKTLIMTIVPLRKKIAISGTVITFRDKTEMNELVNTLFEVTKYSDDLRAQTHEYMNKLYVISALLQLQKYNEAVKMIQEEIDITQHTNTFILENIKDPNVQAILFGKIGKASENKIIFNIDENSSIAELPKFIGTGLLTIIIGNLIDNAFEEVIDKPNGEVNFFALDLGKDVIFEVSDNGRGIDPVIADKIFTQGFSTKGKNEHGYGLSNVMSAIQDLGGEIQWTSNENGTIFTVYIPKNRNS
ncbi:sensor histidine kinase [Sporosarcina thermotolerans]|uniref:histidine kinase n=1 Tax=Sporosarcina thermotolerans TaxID=633404 RepID=A0AAW9A686_9BACL|nr:sensor histidine kinase [Sporosarcina thermotolerans]MDW0116108.1 sensor histidine kinase [Sporosarcina thermotolerans]WHT48076.1 sensor histidine kinase [Sporosarcina thermotolerans]